MCSPHVREKRNDLLVGLAVAMVAFLVYANSLGNGFVCDDDVVIVANAALKGNALSLFSGIDVARATELNPYYRPLTLLTFLLEERLHGLTPFLLAASAYVLSKSASLCLLVVQFIRGGHVV